MTREGAIENIKGILEEATQYENAVCYVTSVDEEPLKMAIESLEKQIPKKPKIYGQFMTLAHCPVCECVTSFRQGYCGGCGQALDWGEEND